MKSYLLFTIALLSFLLYGMSSCTDTLPDPSVLDCSSSQITYVGHVKGILDANCSFSNCHDGQSQAAFGAYSTLGTARMESMFQRVCISKTMPPLGMSAEKIDTIRCWSENGYLEQ